MTQPRIKPLPPATSALIAAGEIIHGPKDVLKELLENALDAGATEITIELQKGGIERVSVRDNGHGILADDLAQAPKRYTTSKLRHVDDLRELVTYGFRGEALFSISSVSNFTIRSRPKEQEVGQELRLWSPQREWAQQSCAMEPGTEILCEHLFAPMPVRRQFLKSPRLESRRCVQAAMNVLLIHPHCQVRCTDQGSTQLNWPTESNRCERFARALQLPREGWQCHQHDCDRGTIFLWYYPSHTKGLQQYWYCHGRWFSDKVLLRLAQQFFEQGALIIDLQISRPSIDVNFHPQKHEIDFVRKEGLMASLTDLFHQVSPQKLESMTQEEQRSQEPEPVPLQQRTHSFRKEETCPARAHEQSEKAEPPKMRDSQPAQAAAKVLQHQPTESPLTPSGRLWVFLSRSQALYCGKKRAALFNPQKLGQELCAKQPRRDLLLPIPLSSQAEEFLKIWPCEISHGQLMSVPQCWDRFWLVAVLADFCDKSPWYRRFYQGFGLSLWDQSLKNSCAEEFLGHSQSLLTYLTYEEICERLSP